MIPNAATHNPDPDYLRGLIAASGVSINECAKRCGVSKSNFKQWLDSKHPSEAPYAIQFCLEVLSQNSQETL